MLLNQLSSIQLSPFAEDVLHGLSKSPKSLHSRYFYDEIGDALFQEIMYMPEYYLTREEYAILSENKDIILKRMGGEPFDLLEFGAGDAYKTKILLHYFQGQKVSFNYVPIDISAHILGTLEKQLEIELPGLSVNALQDEYFHALNKLNSKSSKRKLVLFLGSNIGNLTDDEALQFLKGIYEGMQYGDFLLMGVDLRKDPRLILAAYNDKAGITASFNLNLLTRLNRELGAEFDLNTFSHFPVYDPSTATAKSFLVSNIKQSVYIDALSKTIFFEAGEAIATEISKKYDIPGIRNWAKLVGFTIREIFTREGDYFADILFEKIRLKTQA